MVSDSVDAVQTQATTGSPVSPLANAAGNIEGSRGKERLPSTRPGELKIEGTDYSSEFDDITMSCEGFSTTAEVMANRLRNTKGKRIEKAIRTLKGNELLHQPALQPGYVSNLNKAQEVGGYFGSDMPEIDVRHWDERAVRAALRARRPKTMFELLDDDLVRSGYLKFGSDPTLNHYKTHKGQKGVKVVAGGNNEEDGNGSATGSATSIRTASVEEEDALLFKAPGTNVSVLQRQVRGLQKRVRDMQQDAERRMREDQSIQHFASRKSKEEDAERAFISAAEDRALTDIASLKREMAVLRAEINSHKSNSVGSPQSPESSPHGSPHSHSPWSSREGPRPTIEEMKMIHALNAQVQDIRGIMTTPLHTRNDMGYLLQDSGGRFPVHAHNGANDLGYPSSDVGYGSPQRRLNFDGASNYLGYPPENTYSSEDFMNNQPLPGVPSNCYMPSQDALVQQLTQQAMSLRHRRTV